MDEETRMLRDSLFICALFWAAMLSLVFLSVGCTETTGTDQCLRREIFMQCMKSLPAGPVETKYNDWDEVVAECATVSYYQSLRVKSQITAQCGL